MHTVGLPKAYIGSPLPQCLDNDVYQTQFFSNLILRSPGLENDSLTLTDRSERVTNFTFVGFPSKEKKPSVARVLLK